MCFADDTPHYLELLKSWLDAHDAPTTP